MNLGSHRGGRRERSVNWALGFSPPAQHRLIEKHSVPIFLHLPQRSPRTQGRMVLDLGSLLLKSNASGVSSTSILVVTLLLALRSQPRRSCYTICQSRVRLFSCRLHIGRIRATESLGNSPSGPGSRAFRSIWSAEPWFSFGGSKARFRRIPRLWVMTCPIVQPLISCAALSAPRTGSSVTLRLTLFGSANRQSRDRRERS
jgi:hypothetical protein